MKLTDAEKKICAEYARRGDDGLVRCNGCPLNLNDLFWTPYDGMCYATEEARRLPRYREEYLNCIGECEE